MQGQDTYLGNGLQRLWGENQQLVMSLARRRGSSREQQGLQSSWKTSRKQLQGADGRLQFLGTGGGRIYPWKEEQKRTEVCLHVNGRRRSCINSHP